MTSVTEPIAQTGTLADKTQTVLVCERHGLVPAEYAVSIRSVCYGPLFECAACERVVCAGYGADDAYSDLCDACWQLEHGGPYLGED